MGLRLLPHLALLIRRVLLIVNPSSRRGALTREAVRRAIAAAGVECREVLTERAGHAAELARDGAAGVDAVFVLGGDGTLMEVAGALAGSGKPIGALPGGTGNLMGGVLGVPRRVTRAVHALLRGVPRAFDLGRLSNGRRFIFAAGTGIDSEMVLRTTVRHKRHLGIVGYAIMAARTALRLERFDVEAEVDGVPLRARASLVLIANAGALFGNVFAMGPDIRPNDGRLDLCVYAPRRVSDLFVIAWRLLRKDFRPDARLLFARGGRIRLTSYPVRAIEADGELVGETPAEAVVEPGAVTFLVPPRSGDGAHAQHRAG